MPMRGIARQYTQPPKGSLTGMPSTRTRLRDTPEGPTPRKVTPCELGSAATLLDLRKSAKEGTDTSSSSSVLAALRWISARGITVTVVGTPTTGRVLRVAVMTISSPGD